MSVLPRYPEYRTTALSYARELPAHWDERPNVRLFALRKERGRPEMPILEVSIRSGVAVRDMESGDRKQVMSDLELYQRACPGDIAYNTMRMWQGAVGCVPTEGLVSPAYVIVRPQPTVNSEFYARLFRTPEYLGEISRYSHGIVLDRNRLYWDSFKQISSVLPPREEQDAVVRFLEEKERDIEHYLAMKRRIAAGIGATRQACIDSVVNRYIAKPIQIRRIAKFVTSGSRGWAEYCGAAGAAFIRIGSLTRGSLGLRIDEIERLNLPPSVRAEAERSRILPGDILLSITAYVGSVAVAPVGIEEAYVSQHVALVRLRSDVEVAPKWAGYCLLSSKGQEQGEKMTYGGTKVGLSLDDVRSYEIPVPALAEQHRAIAEIERSLEQSSSLLRMVTKQITAMEEYRTRLIADAVTGQIDVRRAT